MNIKKISERSFQKSFQDEFQAWNEENRYSQLEGRHEQKGGKMKRFIQSNVDFYFMMLEQEIREGESTSDEIFYNYTKSELEAWRRGVLAGQKATAKRLKEIFEKFCLEEK